MPRCYSEAMRNRQPLPAIWLISDARNDAVLERALAEIPTGSGFVFRHHHLEATARQHRFEALRKLCRQFGHLVLLAGDADTAKAWAADGIYGPPNKLSESNGLLRFATVHDLGEVSLANQAKVDGMFLSPVFPTRSHPLGACLGPADFNQLAALAESPVIALGGMDAQRAKDHGWPRWAGIDAFLR